MSVEDFLESALRRLQLAPRTGVHVHLDALRADGGDQDDVMARAFRVLTEVEECTRERKARVVLHASFPLEDSTRLETKAPTWQEVPEQLIASPALLVTGPGWEPDQQERHLQPLEALPEGAGAAWTATYECWRSALSVSAGWEEYARQIVVTVVPSAGD